MTQLISECLLYALVPFAITLIIDLCLGYPAKDKFNKKAIFFFFSLWLAERRLKRNGEWWDIHQEYKDGMNRRNRAIKHEAEEGYKQAVFDYGRKYFFWELGVGMCPFCTGIRISIIFTLLCSLLLGMSWYALIFIPCFSNLYLLIYEKI